jgi:hypothetical protein
MKRPRNYKPKFSLSIFYLRKIMSKKELDALLEKYVTAKMTNWKTNIRGK